MIPVDVNKNPETFSTQNATGDARGLGGGYNLRIRGTTYFQSSVTSTKLTAQEATATQVGIAAVDPRKIAYGSQIAIQTSNGIRYYLAADTSSAVRDMTASNGTAPVIAFYASQQTWDDYTNVRVTTYSGFTSFQGLTLAQQQACLDISKFK